MVPHTTADVADSHEAAAVAAAAPPAGTRCQKEADSSSELRTLGEAEPAYSDLRPSFGSFTGDGLSYSYDETPGAGPPSADIKEDAPINGVTVNEGNGLYLAGVDVIGDIGGHGEMQYGSTAAAVLVGDVDAVDAATGGTDAQWGWTVETGDGAWGTDDAIPGFDIADELKPCAGGAAFPEPLQPPKASTMDGSDSLSKPSAVHPVALRPRCGSGAAMSPELLAAAAAVAFPGSNVVARIRRGLMDLLRDRDQYNPMGFAEMGLRLARHSEVGSLWTAATNQLPKLREFVEATAAAAPGILALERCESGFRATLNKEALRLAALRRAVAAAYPGGDDVSVVRRAAAAALVDAETPIPGVRHSLNMPSLGVCVIQLANEPRQRLAEARGTLFSLAGILQDRKPPAVHTSTNSAGHHGDANGDEVGPTSYIILSNVGPSRVARLDVDRLLLDAAAGRLGDLTVVQPVKPRAAISGTAIVSRNASATPFSFSSAATAAATAVGSITSRLTGAPSSQTAAIVPHVKDMLRAAIPEGRPEMTVKRCLALLAAASLGGGPSASEHTDPPHTLRSSPCGLLLNYLGLKPPKGQMRDLFEDEPHVFKAGKPSPNYLIELVYQPLLDLSVNRPEDLAASVAALLQGRTYPGLRFMSTDTAKAAAEPSPPLNSSRFNTATTTTTPTTTPAASPCANSNGRHVTAVHQHQSSMEIPPGQPPDYFRRLERAMMDRLEGSSSTEFLTRARRVLATALLRRTWWGHGVHGPPPHAMTFKDASTLLKTKLPEAYQEKRPPGVFPVNAQVLAQQMPLLFTLTKPSSNPKDWYIGLNISSLELSAGLNPTPVPERDVAAAAAAAATSESYDEPNNSGHDDYNVDAAYHVAPSAAAPEMQTVEPQPQPQPQPQPSAAEVADALATQPARALATALASMVPPDLLPDPQVQIITVPYSAEHVTALSHCLSCPQIGLGLKSIGGMPAVVLLYAPAVDSLKPAAANAAGGGTMMPPPASGVLPATVYVLDASGAAAAAMAQGATSGGSSDAGVVLLASFKVLLEEPGVAKVVHGCEQLVPALEHVVGCVISPLLDTRLVSEMLRPLDLNPALPSAPEEPQKPDDGRAPELWPQPSNWQTALSIKYNDYHMAVLHHASGADGFWLNRPLNETHVGMLVGAVQHLPELWSALTWLLPRLAQFCSIARAQQCRAILASPAPVPAQW